MAILTFTAMSHAQKVLIDDVVATVGDDAILRSDIEYQYEQALIDGATYGGDMKCHIFEQLLIQKLMINQAKIDSIMVQDNEVVNQVDSRINYFMQQVGGQEKLEEYFNKPLTQIKRDQMDIVRTQLITQKMQGEITKDIKITPSEIRRYYSQMSEDSIPFVPAQYEIMQIVLFPAVEQEEIDRIKGRLREFQKQVAEGRDFATLAVLYSDDPGSASRGGDLGWYSKAGFVPEFSAVAFNLQEKGKVSKIVETEFGYHIIQLIDKKGDRINCRHILMKPKISVENKKKASDFLDTITSMIAKDKITFEHAAIRYSMDKDSRSNGGLMVNPNNGSTKFQINELPAEVAKAIQGLKEGEYSKPFMMVDERRGKETYRIVMLKRRHEPHKANIRDDYSMLQTLMEERKRKDVVDNWIKQRIKELYVNISPEWQNCDFEYEGWVR
jgi:peptidyl-prolyl cis-trans isomerase SurA